MRRSALLLSTILTATASSAQTALTFDDDDVIDLGEIVLSATATPTEADRVGATVDVIGEDEIARSGEDRVTDLLERRPGLTFAANGPPGTTGSLRIRGLPARYISFRFDGIDISDPTEPQVAFNAGALPSAGLGAIEVLRGSQSALYGTQAVGGVVSVRSLAFPEQGTVGRASVEVGADAYRAVSGAFATGFAQGGVRGSVVHLRGDGFSAADENDGNDETDPFRATRLTFGAFREFDGITIGADVLYLDAENAFDESFPAIADGAAPFEEVADSETLAGRVYLQFDLGGVASEIAYARTRVDRVSGGDFGDAIFDGTREELSYDGTVEIGARTTLAFGASTTEETYEDNFGVTGDERVNAVYAEGQFRPTDALDIAITARVDDHSRFGTYTSGRLAAAYRIGAGTVLRGSIANGFRAPSVYELNAAGFGNPNLDPETSRSLDLGVEHSYASGATVAATLFYTEIDDLIDFAGGAYTQIPGTTRTRGIELEASAPLGESFFAFGTFTYTDTETPSGAPLPRTPERSGAIGIEGDFGDRWSGQAALRFASGAVDGGTDLAGYGVLDLGAAYRLTDTAEVYVRVENALDKEYQTVAGYGTADRSVFVGLRASY